MPKAIIFDLGGTLMSFGDPEMDFRELSLIGIQALEAELGRQPHPSLPPRDELMAQLDAEMEESWQRSLTTLKSERLDHLLAQALRRWALGHDDLAVSRLLDLYHRAMQPFIRLYDDTLATLEAFRRAGRGIGLISNTIWTPEMHDLDLQRCGIAGFFDHKLYSSSFGHVKPHPAIFEASLRALGVLAAEAVFVGDRIVDDIGGAQGVGMRAVLKDPPERDESHASIIPDVRINTLGELEELVLRTWAR